MKTSVAVIVALVLTLGIGARADAQNPDGFSRADQFSEPPPVVTTRLYTLDERGFPTSLPKDVAEARKRVFRPANAWEELDDIYGLMALAVVHADWQEAGAAQARGYNIGGIMIDDRLELVNWERNSNEAMCNGTQHGETRMMLKQLNRSGSGSLGKHQIYTSLEPCMMCSGMMMQQSVLRTVYMQTDNGFGKNIERLTIDTTRVPIRFDDEETGREGYPPAARPVISNMGGSEFRVELDVAWRAASSAPKAILTKWLKSAEAEDVYRRARKKFEKYPLRFGKEKAVARFIVPKGGAGKAKMAEKDFLVLRAAKTNKELYAEALRFFNDPERNVIPYVDPDGPDGPKPLAEDRANVFATRLLEDPAALVRAEHPAGEPGMSGPKAAMEVVDGMLGGKHVHQERVRLDGCPHP